MSLDERFEKMKTPGISGVKNVTIEKWIAYGMFLLLLVIPLFTSLYNQLLFGKFISYMIFALALDILWGYAGLMNLGFALFFGLGGYVLGIGLSCQTGLPAFMEFGGLTQIPLLYKPLLNIPFAVLMGLIVPSIVAFILGLFIFYSKIKGVFYNLITLALVALFELLLATKQMYTGGSSGISGIGFGLEKITFPDKVASLAPYLFRDCKSLKIVEFDVCKEWMILVAYFRGKLEEYEDSTTDYVQVVKAVSFRDEDEKSDELTLIIFKVIDKTEITTYGTALDEDSDPEGVKAAIGSYYGKVELGVKSGYVATSVEVKTDKAYHDTLIYTIDED